MKRLFTLFAGMLLVSSAAFAQVRWTSVIVNGNMEGAADPMWSSYWCHDWRQGVEFDPESGQEYAEPSGNATVENPPCMFMGFAEIVEDPADPTNHCARVVIRSKAEADETGTATTDNANNKPDWAEWDSQFFIYATEPIPEGKEIRMILKVKGEKAGSFQTQAHYKPGDYNHYQLFGDLNYGTEWTVVEATTTVTSSHTQESNGKFFQSVAFNLATMQDGNTVYFDDVKLDIRDPQGAKEFDGWYNLLSDGTMSEDVMPQNASYTTFTGRDGIDGVDRKARIVNDPTDGKPALNVTTVAYEGSNQIPEVDDNGDPVLDDEGNPTYKEENYWHKRFYNEDGTYKDSLMTRNIDDWECQFFVSVPHTFTTVGSSGEKIKIRYSARADIPTTLDTQAHTNPGGYIHWSFIGSPELTEEWQEFEYEGTIPSEAKGTWTIAFNCNKDKNEVNNIYFRFEEFSINSADVKEEERVVASESIYGPVPAKGASDPTELKIDMGKAVEALGAKGAADLIEGAAFLKVSFLDESENVAWAETQPDYFIDANGYYDENGEGINFAYNEDKTDGNVIIFDIYNDNIDINSTIPTKLIINVPEDKAVATGYARRSHSYLYNITLMSVEAYEKWQSGVKDITVEHNNNGIIYDLMGRKVVNVGKGLYIRDGKKFIGK